MSTHYETLRVAKTATPDEIKKAYRKLASQHHPDKGGDTAKFQQIEEAYRILSDPAQKQTYDAGGSDRPFNFHDFGQGVPPEMQDIFHQFGFHFGNMGQRQQRRNRDLRIELPLDLADTLSTQKRTISVQTTNGTRQAVEIDIPRGIAHGNIIKYPELGDNLFATLQRGDLHVVFVINPHPRFQVNGNDLYTGIDINCLDAIIGCTVEFTTLDNRTFSLTVPQGTQPGTKFKIGGQGLYGLNHDQRGNLYLIANITVPTNLSEQQMDAIRKLSTI